MSIFAGKEYISSIILARDVPRTPIPTPLGCMLPSSLIVVALELVAGTLTLSATPSLPHRRRKSLAPLTRAHITATALALLPQRPPRPAHFRSRLGGRILKRLVDLGRGFFNIRAKLACSQSPRLKRFTRIHTSSEGVFPSSPRPTTVSSTAFWSPVVSQSGKEFASSPAPPPCFKLPPGVFPNTPSVDSPRETRPAPALRPLRPRFHGAAQNHWRRCPAAISSAPPQPWHHRAPRGSRIMTPTIACSSMRRTLNGASISSAGIEVFTPSCVWLLGRMLPVAWALADSARCFRAKFQRPSSIFPSDVRPALRTLIGDIIVAA
ncbi:hypothetical protein C8R46DRAFT_1309317 [Mycena filopes]|nr:hypothetical protein C8R46DRAFT_1309317 [Mycena filopes]